MPASLSEDASKTVESNAQTYPALVAQPLRLPRRDSSRRFRPRRAQDSTRVSSRQAKSLRHGTMHSVTGIVQHQIEIAVSMMHPAFKVAKAQQGWKAGCNERRRRDSRRG